MKHISLFWPLTLIGAGAIWIMINMRIVPAANLWALGHMLPYVLIGLGLGLILRTQWPLAGMIVTTLIVAGAVLGVVYAAPLGWTGVPAWGFQSGIGGAVSGSGRIVTETREVKDFLAVTIEYPAEVVIVPGPVESVKLEADDNLLPQLSTSMNMGTLYVRSSEKDWARRVNPSRPVKITITVKDLRELDFTTAGTVRIENLHTDDLKLVLSGAGDITLAGINVRGLDCRLSGAGNIHADGVADQVSLRIDGFGTLYGDNLFSMTADVRINGTGNANLRVKNELSVEINGAGAVGYYGSPQVRQLIAGAGTVHQLGK